MTTGDASRFEIARTNDDLSEPVEGELRREPVPDADAACPHCGSRRWLLIEKRAEAEEPFTRWQALACAACGLSDGWGPGGRARPGRGDVGPTEARVPGLPEHPTAHDVARVAPFRVLAPSASPALRHHASTEGRITGVTVAGEGVEVTTEIRHPLPSEPERHARERLQQSLVDRRSVLDRRLSHPARELAFAELARQAEALAGEARAGEVTFELDGARERFSLVRTQAGWAAVAHAGDETVTVAGEGEPPRDLALRTLRAEP